MDRAALADIVAHRAGRSRIAWPPPETIFARIAMRRLILPFSSERWPQRTHLVLDASQTSLKVARGDSFTLAVKVRPGDRVPESATATYHFADGEESSEPLASRGG